MNVQKMMFISNEFSIDELDKFRGSVIEYNDFVKREITSSSIREFEDEVMTSETVTDEDYEPTFTMEDKDILVERIGSVVYDMLLNEELDFVVIVDED